MTGDRVGGARRAISPGFSAGRHRLDAAAEIAHPRGVKSMEVAVAALRAAREMPDDGCSRLPRGPAGVLGTARPIEEVSAGNAGGGTWGKDGACYPSANAPGRFSRPARWRREGFRQKGWGEADLSEHSERAIARTEGETCAAGRGPSGARTEAAGRPGRRRDPKRAERAKGIALPRSK